MKIPRNEPCPCLSGKKYKKCCLDKELMPVVTQAQDGRVLNQAEANTIHQKCLELVDLIAQENLEDTKLAQVQLDLNELYLLQPNHDYVNFVRGLYFIKLEDYAQAVTCFEQAIRAYSLFAEAYYHLAQAYFMQDDLVKTFDCLHKVLEIENLDAQNPNLVTATKEMLAELDGSAQKEYGCSFQAYVKFISLVKRAEACLIAGKAKKAQELFEQVIALKPDCVEAYQNLATIYYQAGKREQALACMTKVFTLDPAKMAQYLAQDEQQDLELADPNLVGVNQTEQQL